MNSLIRAAICVSSLSILVACGGGGSSSSTPVSPPTPVATTKTVTGIAAGGAALSGATVTIKDAKGTTKTATTAQDGTFTIDVTALTAPILFKVTGQLGGSVAYHSVLLTTPAGGANANVNITPLTEAVLALLVGSDPESFYQTPVLSTLTDAALTAAKTSMATLLAGSFTSAGVATGSDMISTPFTANGSGLDKVLDSLQIQSTVSSSGAVLVVVTNNADGSSASLSGSTITGTVSSATVPDLSGISSLLTNLNTALANPTTTNLAPLVDTNFLQNSSTALQFENALISLGAGANFGTQLIQGCKVGIAPLVCRIASTVTLAGSAGSYVYALNVVQESNGQWKFYGNQQQYEIDFQPQSWMNVTYDGSVPAKKYVTGFSTNIAMQQTPGKVGSAVLLMQDTSGTDYTDPVTNLTYRAVLTYKNEPACAAFGLSELSVDGGYSFASNSWTAVPSTYCVGSYVSIDSATADVLARGSATVNPNPKLLFILFSDTSFTTPVAQINWRLFKLPASSSELPFLPYPIPVAATITAVAAYNYGAPLTASWTQPAGAISSLVEINASNPGTGFGANIDVNTNGLNSAAMTTATVVTGTTSVYLDIFSEMQGGMDAVATRVCNVASCRK